jgi:hypothetical protein
VLNISATSPPVRGAKAEPQQGAHKTAKFAAVSRTAGKKSIF